MPLDHGKTVFRRSVYIDRLENSAEWAPVHQEQPSRITGLAKSVGMEPIQPFARTAPAMSWAFGTPSHVTLDLVQKFNVDIVFYKYYKPLADMPKTIGLYPNLLNTPKHPDMAELSDTKIKQNLEQLLAT